jgi:hypothetical protein
METVSRRADRGVRIGVEKLRHRFRGTPRPAAVASRRSSTSDVASPGERESEFTALTTRKSSRTSQA